MRKAAVVDTLEYLVVAGGGSGGQGNQGAGGGGGAGGMLTGTKPIVLATDYTITVGAGGAGRLGTPYYGANGSNSLAFNITAIGGGGGGGSIVGARGQDGGSGGGGNSTGGASVSDGPGLGTAGQGNDGGVTNFYSPNYPAAGGGGAGGIGGNVPSGTIGGAGGAGLSSSITGLSVAYAGGGGGSTYGGGTPGSGGVGGGGGGAGANGYYAGIAGTANTGGGGGGSAGPQNWISGAGGSGVVILKYPNTYSLTIDAGLTSTTDTSVTGFKITTFTAGTGSVQINETGVVEEPEEPVAGFGEVATNFINTFSGTKKFIDITNGSDGNNGDTDAAAYRTLAYAQAQTAAIGTAVMYVIKPGVYDLTPTIILPSFCSVGISDGNLPRTFFCAAGQVILQWTANSAERDAGMTNLQNANSAMYGAILKRNNNGKTNAYSVGMINGETAEPSNGDFYNCVFQETNANGNWALQYDNGGDEVTSILNNCSFYTTETGTNDYAGGPGLILNNNAFRYAPGTTGATLTNAVTAQTMDATTYELTANNNTHGVYSGTYAWGTDMWVPEALRTLDYLVVGGGGGGSNYGGGGAGGYRTATNQIIDLSTNYTVTVGSGGSGGTTGANGSNSVFLNITAAGGGRGGVNPDPATGADGGSGGGGRFGYIAGGSGNTPSVSPSQGNDGGSGGNSTTYLGGGGGGAGAVGGNGAEATDGAAGAGGNGLESSITGSALYYAGGGGGGGYTPPGAAAPGGLGGGGVGGKTGSNSGGGVTNTGGGGGGAGNTPSSGSSGGSGVVILKYPAAWLLTIDAGLTSTTDTSVTEFKITTFTAGTGSIQFSEPAAASSTNIEYLMVAGGASGGSYGGGGGAGGLLQGSMSKSTGDVHTFTVGAGGAGFDTNVTYGNDGSNSVALGLTAIGGGGGAHNGSSPTSLAAHTGRPGGSGGGAGSQNYTSGAPGGAGTAGQGNKGGNATTPWAGQRSRGGGGAGAAGVDGTGASVGTGGAGLSSSIIGSAVAYAGGGGGYNWASAEKASGGSGVGGAGGASGSIQGTSATANRGGGGGGGGPNTGAGGSGIIILKYPDTLTLTIGAGLTSTTDSSTVAGYKITTFTAGTGNVTF